MLGTQTVATLFAVYGFLMTPLGWGWAGFVWAYAVAWFLLNDRVKLLAYRILDPPKAKTPVAVAPQAAGTASNLTAEIATKAYQLYEQEGHNDGHADQDWREAEREIRDEETAKKAAPPAKEAAPPAPVTTPKG